ncbi:MAG: septal ring lytic transglycosylase RlpA family protein [Rhizobiaceae bacterium]|nr:septal ring lytic transglycosylase RlpA family protein [Rhizobiaceae bacterium]
MGLKTNLLSLVLLGGGVAGCGGIGLFGSDGSHINKKVKFSEDAYGVAASPRVTTSRKVRKGGGRRQIGRPYKIKGKWYTPREDFDYSRTGQASWYGPNFHGRLTANGEIYDQYALTAAHPTFPLPSYARVTNLANGRSLIVRVNDRGPYHDGRIIDLSAKASEMLNYQHLGVARVRVEYIKQAPLHGRDHKMLASSYRTEPAGTILDTDIASRILRNRRRPSIIRLGDLTTGSISKKLRQQDPFSAALGAIGIEKDDNSTLGLRLSKK